VTRLQSVKFGAKKLQGKVLKRVLRDPYAHTVSDTLARPSFEV
jgi:hypothetical protein